RQGAAAMRAVPGPDPAPRRSLGHGHHEVLHDVLATVGRVPPHVEAEDVGRIRPGRELDLAEAHIGADELAELPRGDLTQTLEAGDLGGAPDLLRRGVAFRLGV